MIDYKLYLNGEEVTASVYEVWHDMYSENHADTAEFMFNDTAGSWVNENIVVGDRLRFVYGACDTGDMYATTITPSKGMYSIFAAAIPYTAYMRRFKSWEGVTFADLGKEIAANHGLEYAEYDCDPIVYEYIKQDGQDDFTFLNTLATYEGRGMLVFNKQIIAYDQKTAELREDAKPIAVAYDGDYEYNNNAGDCFGRCVVISGGSYGEVYDPFFDQTKVLYPQHVHAINNTVAHRWAHGILRNANKNVYDGVMTARLLADICAASIIRPVNKDNVEWNENMFVTRVRQSYLRNETKIWFRKPYDF